MKYDKEPNSPEKLANKLILNNNLSGISVEELSNILTNISYYRLKGYILPYYDKDKVIKDNVTWNQIWNDYNFDIELKALIFREIGKIEVALRTILINTFSHIYGMLWYDDSSLFYNQKKYEKDKEELFKYWERSSENFKQHFTKKYSGNPPCWMIFETASFGCLSKIYENLKKSKNKEIIAQKFGFNKSSEKVLISWFRHLVYVRNIIAHYGRLFTKRLVNKPIISKDKSGLLGTDLEQDKLFSSIIIIAYLLKVSNNDYKMFIGDLTSLLSKYNTVNIKFMGFNDEWKNIEIIKSCIN